MQEVGGTRKGEPFLKKGGRILREGNRRLVYQFIENNLNDFGLRWLLRKFSLSATAYYNYLKQSKVSYYKEKMKIQEAMKNIYHTCGGTSGYRLIRDLLYQNGIKISYTTAYKYMTELGLKATILSKKQSYVKGTRHKVFDNLLDRNFHAEKPNQKWYTDFTYLSLVGGQKRYDCSIIDLYDRSIVATLNSNYIDSALAEDTLKLALKKHKVSENLILHSDQGSQFCSISFTDFCLEKGITQSMS